MGIGEARSPSRGLGRLGCTALRRAGCVSARSARPPPQPCAAANTPNPRDDLLTCCLLGKRPEHCMFFVVVFSKESDDQLSVLRRYQGPESGHSEWWSGSKGLCPVSEGHLQSRARPLRDALLASFTAAASPSAPEGGLITGGEAGPEEMTHGGSSELGQSA